MMPKGQSAIHTFACRVLGANPSPQICVQCIEASSVGLRNTDRMMTDIDGETVGVKMQNARQVRDWMQSLDRNRCPCVP